MSSLVQYLCHLQKTELLLVLRLFYSLCLLIQLKFSEMSNNCSKGVISIRDQRLKCKNIRGSLWLLIFSDIPSGKQDITELRQSTPVLFHHSIWYTEPEFIIKVSCLISHNGQLQHVIHSLWKIVCEINYWWDFRLLWDWQKFFNFSSLLNLCICQISKEG